MKLLLDTNTVVSGALWGGPPRQILDLARAGRFRLYTSTALLLELAEVLGRTKFAARFAYRGIPIVDAANFLARHDTPITRD